MPFIASYAVKHLLDGTYYSKHVMEMQAFFTWVCRLGLPLGFSRSNYSNGLFMDGDGIPFAFFLNMQKLNERIT